MQADPRISDDLPDSLLRPSYWLVSGLEWRAGESGMAEAAVAIAPSTIPGEAVSRDAHQVLGCADLYARKCGHQVVFFSDLTLMFTDAGTSWSQLGVDWERALEELRGGRFPALFLTISEQTHLVICDPASRPAVVAASSEEDVGDERDLLRQAVAQQLVRDWPPYLQSAARAGLISTR